LKLAPIFVRAITLDATSVMVALTGDAIAHAVMARRPEGMRKAMRKAEGQAGRGRETGTTGV
jgi:hypothetical protein